MYHDDTYVMFALDVKFVMRLLHGNLLVILIKYICMYNVHVYIAN